MEKEPKPILKKIETSQTNLPEEENKLQEVTTQNTEANSFSSSYPIPAIYGKASPRFTKSNEQRNHEPFEPRPIAQKPTKKSALTDALKDLKEFSHLK